MTENEKPSKPNMWNVRTPFMRPVSRRVILSASAVAWGLFEMFYANKLFGILFLGAGAYLIHQFFIVFDPEDYERRKD